MVNRYVFRDNIIVANPQFDSFSKPQIFTKSLLTFPTVVKSSVIMILTF
jgi:hypothetical protein